MNVNSVVYPVFLIRAVSILAHAKKKNQKTLLLTTFQEDINSALICDIYNESSTGSQKLLIFI